MIDLSKMTAEEIAELRELTEARAIGYASAVETGPNDPRRGEFYDRLVKCNELLKEIDRRSLVFA